MNTFDPMDVMALDDKVSDIAERKLVVLGVKYIHGDIYDLNGVSTTTVANVYADAYKEAIEANSMPNE